MQGRLLLPLALTLLFPTLGSAATITLTFTGTVTSIDPSLASVYAVGDAMSGSLSYDSTASDNDPDTAFGSYDGATNLSFDVEGDVASAPLGFVEISNDLDTPGFDSFRAAVVCEAGTVCNAPAPAGASPNSWELVLFDSTASVFSDDSLPTSLSLGGFDDAFVALIFSGDEVGGIVGITLETLTVTVPEPGVLGLLALAGAAALARRARAAQGAPR